MGGKAARRKPREFHRQPDHLVLHVIPASQYSNKVLMGLTSRGMPHFLEFAAPEPDARQLPTGGKAVPEIEFKGEGVTDSTAILHFLDQHLPEGAEPFFPAPHKEAIEEVNKLAEEYFDGFCDYFNFVDETGYRSSVRNSLARYKPWWAFWVDIDRRLQPVRDKKALNVDKAFDRFGGDHRWPRDKVLVKLNEQLKEFQLLLKSDDQEFLFETRQPSAADLAVFAKLCRMLDWNGDVSIGVSVPGVLDDPELQRLNKWFEHMKTVCPIQWKGKRPPQLSA